VFTDFFNVRQETEHCTGILMMFVAFASFHTPFSILSVERL